MKHLVWSWREDVRKSPPKWRALSKNLFMLFQLITTLLLAAPLVGSIKFALAYHGIYVGSSLMVLSAAIPFALEWVWWIWLFRNMYYNEDGSPI